jgi:type IV pilus assembly protein PilF
MLYCRSLCLVILGAALCLTCLGCATSTQGDSSSRYDAEQLREMGERLVAAGDTANGLRYLTQAREKRPKDPRIYYALGLAYDARNLQTEAVQQFQEALRLKPDYSEAYNAMGRVYAQQGKSSEAEQAFQQAAANPFYQTPYLPLFNLGLLYERQGQWQTALSYYEQAVAANRNYSLAYYCMGRVLEALGRNDQALQAYSSAVQRNSNLTEAYFSLGRLSYADGDYENAAFSFNRVLRLAPDTPLAAQAAKYLQTLSHSPDSR